MADPDREAENTVESETEADEGEEYEVERPVSRDDGATVLRLLADGVANGSVELTEEGIVAAIPERFELEIEYERDEEAAELEVELEWPIADGEPVAIEREAATREESTGNGDDMEDVPVTTGDADEEDELDEVDEPAANDAPVHELVGPGDAASKAEFELYRDRADEWRWRLVHDNGNIIADSGEGYKRKATARKGLESVMRNAPAAGVAVREE